MNIVTLHALLFLILAAETNSILLVIFGAFCGIVGFFLEIPGIVNALRTITREEE